MKSYNWNWRARWFQQIDNKNEQKTTIRETFVSQIPIIPVSITRETIYSAFVPFIFQM